MEKCGKKKNIAKLFDAGMVAHFADLSYASLFNDASSNNCIVGGGNGGSLANIRFEDRNSISDVIESVVNAARNHSEDSRESNSSSSDTKSIGTECLLMLFCVVVAAAFASDFFFFFLIAVLAARKVNYCACFFFFFL